MVAPPTRRHHACLRPEDSCTLTVYRQSSVDRLVSFEGIIKRRMRKEKRPVEGRGGGGRARRRPTPTSLRCVVCFPNAMQEQPSNPRALLPWLRSISMWILLSLFVVSASASGASDDAAALLAFKARADPGNRLPFFPATNGSSSDNEHCRWPGVWCSPDGRVVRLVLEAGGLAGVFAGGTLDRLDQLRILSLKANSLTGPLPDLSPLLNLKALFLSRNRFVGAFPASVLSLHRLRTLDLSYNNLSGPIPPSLAALDRLYALRLESNRFSGPIPPLNQSSLVNFNVSYNNFSGRIPATAALSSFAASAFAANPGLCGGVLRKKCGGGNVSRTAPSPANAVAGEHEGIRLPSSASPAQKMHKRAVVAVGFLASSFLVIGVLGFSLLMQKKRSRMKRGAILGPVKHQANGAAEAPESNLENLNAQTENRSHELMAAASLAMSEEKVKKLSKSGCLVFCAGEAPVYNLQQLMKASAEMLGRGSAGSTYKAVLENRLMVSVKRLDAAKLVTTGKEVFERHMEMLGRLRHPNLVPLRAYFKAKEERLLVYDYHPNGSLSSLVHGSRSTRPKPLHWTSCLKIAEDVAHGLGYIHQASRLVHGNVKSSNVLLGSDFEACLTDNCLAFLMKPSDNEDDIGYRAPESQNSNGGLTPSSDIYAFGVLLLELLTGKRPSQQPVLVETTLPVWVRSMREDVIEGADDERLMMIIDIAAACVHLSPDSRPTAWQILKMIEEVKEVDTGDHDSGSASLS
ncbi:probable inactive receptor kinase At5g67200 [Musa acuminata AAA Group]|uniref:probable inactive receptor kinase At5g67200 n=1 Tax=Musa acuminata AAA Group TaxID=214697 RepID=UPI0031D91FF3